MIREEGNVKNTVYSMINNVENDKEDEHKKNIEK